MSDQPWPIPLGTKWVGRLTGVERTVTEHRHKGSTSPTGHSFRDDWVRTTDERGRKEWWDRQQFFYVHVPAEETS